MEDVTLARSVWSVVKVPWISTSVVLLGVGCD